jgi:hypothetical protein
MSAELKKQLTDKQAEFNANLEVIQHLSHKNENLLEEIVNLITDYFQAKNKEGNKP